MAFPVILVNSATGSDSAASGAGPATALTGVAGVTSADGLTVTLDGSPDLTNVPTDGSAVIFMSDTNAGSRNFGKITSKGNSGTPTAFVGVSDAFQALNTDAWAIGGKRASIGSTTSLKLFDNNSAAGDAMPGWVVEMQSAHAETIAAALVFRRGGDSTSGPIILRGEAGAGTKPIVTFSNNGSGIVLREGCWINDFELRNSNATKTASVAITTGFSSGGTNTRVSGMKVSHSTDKFWRCLVTAFAGNTNSAITIINNEFGFAAQHGILTSDPISSCLIAGNYIHDCTSEGVALTSDVQSLQLKSNVIDSCGGIGINVGPSIASPARRIEVIGNTVYGCTSDGIRVSVITTVIHVINNICTNNGGYGLNHSSGSGSDAQRKYDNWLITGNNFDGNTSGDSNPSGLDAGNPSLNPNFVDAPNGNFTPQEATLEGAAFPESLNGISSFGWPGVIQPQDSGGGPSNRGIITGGRM